MEKLRRLVILPIAIVVLAACQSGTGESPTESAADSAMESASVPAESDAADGAPCDNPAEGDMLATICNAGVIRVATDPAYPPQSELLPDGSYEGFDIDVANRIAEELGVEVEFVTPDFAEVVAGEWAGRFDVSVGSVTITEERAGVLDFTVPYYYTPAQMTATTESGITSLDGLAGEVICAGESTTYQFWLDGTLTLIDAPEPADPPEGATVTTFSTDTECADAIASGRTDFTGWLTSIGTAQGAIDEGAGFVFVGDPVFFEPLAVATDKAADEHTALMAELDRIIEEMHEDGSLRAISEGWFDGVDYTVAE
jgi:polar amino acid transport system substrate-binding protein